MSIRDLQGENINQFVLIMVIILALMVLYTLIGNFLESRNIRVIHETGVGIIIGFILGLILSVANKDNIYYFNQEVFFYGLLPPMIFAGGYNLKKKKFFQNFFYVNLYGLLGTIVMFVFVFGLTYLISELGWVRGWKNLEQKIFLSTSIIVRYSATICASDAVAPLTMIKPSQYPKLFSIIFGEGLINDAVAIILFRVVGGVFDQAGVSNPGEIFGTILWKFVVNVIASVAIGLASAFICCKIFQKARFLSHNPVAEVVLLYIFGTLSYIIAQIANMSGVITVLVCGICLAHLNFYNLSVVGQISTGVAFQSISYAAQAIVFIYLGVSTMFYISQSLFSYTFVLLQLVICIISRFFAIVVLSYLFKLCRKSWNVSFYEIIVVYVAGLIRGSVAFALILTIGSDNEQTKIIQSSVMLMVFITTILLGAALPKFIQACLLRDRAAKEANSQQKPLIEGQQKKQKKQLSGFKKIDEKYLKPFFIYDYEQRKTQIKMFKKHLKLNSSQYRGGHFQDMLQAHTVSQIPSSITQQQHQTVDSNIKYS